MKCIGTWLFLYLCSNLFYTKSEKICCNSLPNGAFFQIIPYQGPQNYTSLIFLYILGNFLEYIIVSLKHCLCSSITSDKKNTKLSGDMAANFSKLVCVNGFSVCCGLYSPTSLHRDTVGMKASQWSKMTFHATL